MQIKGFTDYRLLFVTSLAILLISFSPDIWAILRKEGLIYTGIHSFSRMDPAVYYSFIEQVHDGHFSVKNLFTMEPQGSMIYLFWVVVGVFATLIDQSPPIAYHLIRLLLIPIFLFALWKFIAEFGAKENRSYRFGAFLFMLFGSGLGGWAITLFPQFYSSSVTPENPRFLPFLDLWVADSQNFIAFLSYPHIIASILLYFVTLRGFLRSIEFKKRLEAWGAGLIGGVLVLIHPYHLATLMTVSLLYVLVSALRHPGGRWVKVKQWVRFSLPILCASSYWFVLMGSDPYLEARALQNLCLSPYFWILLISYGALLPFAFFGIWKRYRKKPIDEKNLFLLVWFFAQPLLFYLPVEFQRRFIEGWQIPLNWFAFVGISELWKKMKPPKFAQAIARPIYIISILALFELSPIRAWLHEFTYLNNRQIPAYISSELREVMTVIRERAEDGEGVLARPEVANLIPGFTGRQVFLGHPMETLAFAEKKEELRALFEGKFPPGSEEEFFDENHIVYALLETPLPHAFLNWQVIWKGPAYELLRIRGR